MDISPKELHDWLQKGEALRLVDCREEDEHAICHLEGAELIPLRTFPSEAPTHLEDRAATIVVYCHHGIRSHYACEMLRALGYQSVFNLAGGIDAWAFQLDPDMERY